MSTNDHRIHEYDLKAVLETIGLKYHPVELKAKFAVHDRDKNGYLDEQEFLTFFTSLVCSAEKLPWEKADDTRSKDKEEGDDDDDDGSSDDEMPEEIRDLPVEEQQKAIRYEAFKKMGVGTVLVLLFSDPMVDVLSQIGKVTGIPAFYVSFLLAPMASNASELAASYKLACKKTTSSISDSLQCLVGAANMNNTYCLGIFLALIYVQGLAWKFTAETLSIFFVELLVGMVALKGNTQSVFEGFLVLLLYPLSLVFVAALEACGLD
jgi:Ca2+/Na+ antiporter